jgi:hypothetical protein
VNSLTPIARAGVPPYGYPSSTASAISASEAPAARALLGRRPDGIHVVAHYEEVERVADRVGIIREGRLIALDSVVNLRARALRALNAELRELLWFTCS